MELFYGADTLVKKPIYGLGNPSNDYGLGFYLTPSYEMARLWASKNKEGGFVIKYEVDLAKLNVLYLNNSTEKDILEWITILVEHRFSKDEYEANIDRIEWLKQHHTINLEGIDLIVGYRADDSYFVYSRDFVKDDLSLEKLSEAMRIGKLGLQYVLMSKKAFDSIKMISFEEVEQTDEYYNFREKALDEYKDIRKHDDIHNTFLRDIMRRY